ncbi:MAG: GDYXXLXY domain-containing protein [Candidatus Solibacter usitatus]|nr:GDYXXLXY domain-containing protein [Candidatus Solibacter usitatus]
MRNAILVGLIQAAVLLSITGKFLYDRERLPRVWVKVAPVDPNHLLRGRYVRFHVFVEPANLEATLMVHVRLSVEGERLKVYRNDSSPLNIVPAGKEFRLNEPLAFYIPEHIPDPSRRPAGEELWVEATIPPKGPPRPLRLGIKKDGVLTPLVTR